ncbi:MAG: GNAT family N-acetyltransferase [Candidatus Marinimicrobia bacterium]|nr:GNAT family N-acetyltransferase [Candidatus Neomarinimicrobiota bacterium]MCF7851113.1 GNAT family N-acetyltransferase [Candidatus Neomarinimicrobiota bacterium]MCF7904339.1 GNAT family N-acetyltransferase [Candidatus Neomarinimicrobiota bacterium]
MIFGEHWISPEKYKKVRHCENLLLVAFEGERPVGFKLGFRKDENTFHSWLGGVQEEFRRQGIAQALLDEQERVVHGMGLKRITFNTYDKFPEMIAFGLKNGYEPIGSEETNQGVKHHYLKLLDQG